MRYPYRGDSIPVSGRQCGRSGEKRKLWCVVRELRWWTSMSCGVWPLLMVAVLLASAVFPFSGCKPNEDIDEETQSGMGETKKETTIQEVVFSDPNLEAIIRKTIDKFEGSILSSDLEGLTDFAAWGWNITDLTGLEYCTDLTSLSLYENQLSDISALASLANLTELVIWDDQVSDVSALASLTNLTELWLYGDQISDISALASLTNLTKLWLYRNRISDISALASLTSLTELFLWDVQISDISPLASLTKLTNLFLVRTQIGDISSLASLNNLTRLQLNENQISDISSLASLTNLTFLSLHKNQISDISSLSSLTNLTYLSLYENQITDISPLASLKNLNYLWLNDNQISGISPLANLTNLTGLSLAGNQITDISLLTSLDNLRELNLMGNPLDDKSVNVTIPQLQKTGAQVRAGQPWPSDEIETLPPWPNRPKTGRNPKLDSRLDALVDAEMRGETESFVQSRGFDLVDGSVKVGIECVSGQLEAAIEAAAEYGTVVAIAERAESFSALVPIASLTALTREDSIRFIREPEKPSLD